LLSSRSEKKLDELHLDSLQKREKIKDTGSRNREVRFWKKEG
jgi:hypothetical protein